MEKIEYLILGAGLSGLSASYHIGHKKCLILEKNPHAFGLVYSEKKNGFIWDVGPHVSFTKHDYVRELFAKCVKNNFYEHVVTVGNYFRGCWVDHPVQANLYQVPEPLRSKCVDSFLEIEEQNEESKPLDYREWLENSLGKEITNQFVAPYTRKYWTTDPENLSVDWIGTRVFRPKKDDVLNGSVRKPEKSAHYIKKVRYPKEGGYQSFSNMLSDNANILCSHDVVQVDVERKIVICENGKKFSYNKLINTIPLPEFVSKVKNISSKAKDAANQLACSQLLLVNVEVPQETKRPEYWLYVYDEDKYSTRINFTEKLSEKNTPVSMSGIQVEVYFSRYKPYQENAKEIASVVVEELLEMGLIESKEIAQQAATNITWVPYANIIFDHNREAALKAIFDELEPLGLARREDELASTTDWNNPGRLSDGDIILLGRFGEWKYYWSDDSVLCGRNYAINRHVV
jgi:protoporphyrinogen oxidase